MKSLVVVGVLMCVGFIFAATSVHHRGCIYILGRCYKECPEGTHAFATSCGVKTPEATCAEPNPKPDEGGLICDYSACYCDPPTVRHPETKKCVPLEECPKTKE